MAITNAQRQLALCGIMQAALLQTPSLTPNLQLGNILPGVTAAQVLSTIEAALGTTVDASLTTACTNMSAYLTSVVSTDNTSITALTVS